MTTTNPVPAPRTPDPSFDPRPAFFAALDVATGVVAGVRPDQFGAPTPCEQFDVRGMLGHLVFVLRRVERIGTGGNALQVEPVTGVADAEFAGAWANGVRAVHDAWASGAALGSEVVLPWTTTDGAHALAVYVNEVVVHTWDLARATGQRPVWPDAVVAVAFAAIEVELPVGGRLAAFDALRAQLPPALHDSPPPFQEAVPVDAAAPLIDRLVAHNGRRP